MPTNEQRSSVEKLTRSLLATTCLTALSGAGAMAATIVTEGNAPAPVDFSNIGPGYLLPNGTTSVVGGLSGFESADGVDWFEWANVTGNYSIDAHFTIPFAELGMRIALYDSSELASPINSGTLEGSGTTLTGTLNGNLVAKVFQVNNSVGSYTVDFTGTQTGAVPEPSTMGLAGLGLAGALAWRRRRKA